MSDQAIQDLVFISKRFQGILDLIPSLERLSSLDNAEKEYVSRIETCRRDLASLKDLAVQTEQEIDTAHFKAESILDAATKASQELITQAKAQAENVAKSILSAAEERTSVARTELSFVQAAVKDQEDLLARVTQAVAEKDEKFIEIQKQIEALKSRF